ncbi:MAG TPA: hypothetical protein VMH80_23720 [Bryobacteraceae bacterium]|nr:hypothetical protein [Bryobacteraceae bacterium]
MTNSFQTHDGCAIGYTLRTARDVHDPRLALIHSLALDRTIWDGVARELEGEAHLLAYDCRGGCVAQAFGGLHPQRAAALGLIDTTAWYGTDADRIAAELRALLARMAAIS